MAQSSSVGPDLPASVREALDGFSRELQETFDDQLESIVLYGGFARQDTFDPESSDVKLMVVLKEVRLDSLEKLSAPVQKAMDVVKFDIMVISTNDLWYSTDVFPTTFVKMQNLHRVLAGKDVIKDLDITRDHLRLRCEQEVKELLLKLRSLYIQHPDDAQRIKETLTGTVTDFLGSLHTMIIISDESAPVQQDDILTVAEKSLQLDVRPVQEALAIKAGKEVTDPEAMKRLCGAFMFTVQKAAYIVDQLLS